MTLNKTDRIVITLGLRLWMAKFIAGSPLPAEAELEEFRNLAQHHPGGVPFADGEAAHEMKRYHGAFVAPRNQWNYLDTMSAMGAGKHYDPPLISAMSSAKSGGTGHRPLGSRARDFQRLAQIESALNHMIANNQDREAFDEADIRYHEAVLQSVHNPVLQQLSIAISSLQRRYLNVLDGR
ncbi:FCD domain-containing protein [Shigella flexneri]